MNRILQMKKSTRSSLFTYGLVIAAFAVIQLLRIFREGGVGSVLVKPAGLLGKVVREKV